MGIPWASYPPPHLLVPTNILGRKLRLQLQQLRCAGQNSCSCKPSYIVPLIAAQSCVSTLEDRLGPQFCKWQTGQKQWKPPAEREPIRMHKGCCSRRKMKLHQPPDHSCNRKSNIEHNIRNIVWSGHSAKQINAHTIMSIPYFKADQLWKLAINIKVIWQTCWVNRYRETKPQESPISEIVGCWAAYYVQERFLLLGSCHILELCTL